MDRIQCSFCERKIENISVFQTHLKNDHRINLSKQDVPFICKTNDCMKEFKTWKGFLKHINTMHYFTSNNEVIEVPIAKEISHDAWTPTSLSIETDITEMISDLRLTTNVSGSDFGKFIDSTEQLLSNVLLRVLEKIKDFFKYKNMDLLDPEIISFLNQFYVHTSISNYTCTMQGQIQILKKNNHFIEPKEIHLGHHEELKLDTKTGLTKSVLVEDSFQYIPLIDSLKLILHNEEVRSYIQKIPASSTDGVLTSYRDGENFQNNSFFQKHKDGLGLHLYFDEFLMNNPLGTKTHAQKIGAFYYSIDSLPPHLNNSMANVHVLALCYNKDIHKYGINEFLKPLFIELTQLESDDGVKITICNTDFTIHCTLLTLCADTLAAHEVLGFLSPSANLFCRICDITREEFKNYPWTIACRRTKKSHDNHCLEATIDKTAPSLTGVKCQTILNNLKYFHCTNNNVFDIMHDILEGQGHYALKLVIAHMVSSKNYDLNTDLLNYRITTFQYGKADVENKPSPTLTSISLHNVATEHKLQQRAVQMWCLLRTFPFLIADKVAEGDIYLQYIINLNQIIEIVFAPKIPYKILPYLHELILYHIKQFNKLFPSANPINKLHHMIHYVSCIEECGPLRNLACFKFEAKHQMFKKRASTGCNFKNIIKSISNISQISQCSTWGTGKKQIRRKLQYSHFENVMEHLDDMDRDAVLAIFLTQWKDKNINMVDKVQVYENEYETSLYVVIDSGVDTDKNMPTFGRIHKIFVIEENVYLYCKKWTSIHLKQSLNAYNVEEGQDFIIINTDELCHSKTYSVWKPFSSELKYICLRHILI